jgi:hypothetical protein
MLGPAQRIEADNFAQWVYALEGNFHRDHRQGPAVVATNFEDRGVRREEYCWEGKRHRPASEGPAVIETDASGNVVLQIYVEHGLRHRDPSEGAAWHGFEDGLEFWEYNAQDKLHREDGPAIIGRDPVTGVIACEKYSRHGEPHRRHGPALITRDRETGVLLGEEYYSFGQLHRDAGPAYVGYNLESGKVTYEEYCRDGQTHRDDGPAVIIRYPDGSPHIERWYRGNDCHRDPKDGPAHCERDAQGRVITEEYWEHGVVAEPPSVAATTPNRRARRAKATAGGQSHAKSREDSHA